MTKEEEREIKSKILELDAGLKECAKVAQEIGLLEIVGLVYGMLAALHSGDLAESHFHRLVKSIQPAIEINLAEVQERNRQ